MQPDHDKHRNAHGDESDPILASHADIGIHSSVATIPPIMTIIAIA
jgi:hypothetical protein